MTALYLGSERPSQIAAARERVRVKPLPAVEQLFASRERRALVGREGVVIHASAASFTVAFAEANGSIAVVILRRRDVETTRA